MSTVVISATDARELTDRIKVGVDAIWELIKQAYTSRAWSVLGYSSWDDYCTREFGTSRIRLPREERQEVVASMREIGMSVRAIASATGASYGSVQAVTSGDQKRSPADEAPAPVTGTDGKTYGSRPEPAPEPAPVPDKPKRRPITDQARDAGWELRKAVERLERIASDDRFAENKEKVTPHLRGHLSNAVEVCQDLLDHITN